MKNIVIFVRGDKKSGMGHVVRCITLAEHLAKRDCRVEFVTLFDTPGFDRLIKTKFARRGVESIDSMLTCYNWHADAAILDFECGPTRAMLESARALFPCVINIGGVGWAMQDPAALDDLVDLQIYQSVLCDAPQHPRRLVGVEYMIINPAYGECVADYDGGPVVVSMGGSDPHGLSDLSYSALYGVGREVRLIIGPASEAEVHAAYIGRNNIILWKYPESLIGIVLGASLSLIQLGMTAYESMAAGVPPLLVNLSEDHHRTSVELERLGCAVNLGMWHEFDAAEIRKRVEWLLARPDELRRMGQAGKRLCDARGAGRVAEKIMEMMR